MCLSRQLAVLSAGLRTVAGVRTTPSAVLDFWFAGAWGTPAMASIKEPPLSVQMPRWFGMCDQAEKDAMDASCREFVPLIRACGRGELDQQEEWSTPDGLYAQMLLCDQISRNAFRGSSEAFGYDERGMKMVRKLVDTGCHLDQEAAYYFFLCTPGQHSEKPSDHALNLEIVEYLRERYAGDTSTVDGIMNAVIDHMQVIERFGRYPHRNEVLGRETTEAEAEWLADYDNLPGWAKSQMKKPTS
eukprot:scaffold25994_cov30-Tisochrysis_lutea.AAC.2